MLLLAIETATDVCGVALYDGTRVLADAAVRVPRSHAARLALMIRDLLAHVGATAGDLNVVAVSAGPGSYTGLRIGASTAKGLAWATGAALVAVPSLEAMAHAARPNAGAEPILAAFSSRRGEVYASLFHPETDGLVPLEGPAALAVPDVTRWLPPGGALTLVGPAASEVASALGAAGPVPEVRVDAAEPSAVHVAALGLARHAEGHVENVAAWEPYYLTAFVPGPSRPIFGGGERERG